MRVSVASTGGGGGMVAGGCALSRSVLYSSSGSTTQPSGGAVVCAARRGACQLVTAIRSPRSSPQLARRILVSFGRLERTARNVRCSAGLEACLLELRRATRAGRLGRGCLQVFGRG